MEQQQETETQTEGNTTQATTPDLNKGDKPAEISPLEKADANIKRMEELSAKFEEQLQRQEALVARQTIGGRAEAGQVEETQEEKTKKLVDAAVKQYLG